ncbi:MbtH family protein [Pseudonocardia acaciae]|uniref:MbtH family protein n=1 Tax=Pseudonocardia acaciae TaxID=551276 RepID=UPI000A0259B7|nr:MbtH family NRPS accessory protein [Pseudonocardia acaciae]
MDGEWTVLVNSEEQYGLFPSDLPPPAGWRSAGRVGTEAECVAFVDEQWTDMRPRSVRYARDAAS